MNTLANNPNQWAPYETYKDCSQGICSVYCPQWCYIIFPPPPPFNLGDNSSSTTDFSPLIIAVIGILASALVLVSYYTIISKYCKRRNNDNNNSNNTNDRGGGEFEDNFREGNLQTHPNGLDELLIKSITVCKYKKSEGLIEGTDCSVCLSEFEENESLRLLPKCNHAFHLPCIDTWLKSQSSCPLCRSNITVLSFAGPPHQVCDDDRNGGSINDPNNYVVEFNQHRREESVVVVEELENVYVVESVCENGSKNHSSEQGSARGGEWRVEIGEGGCGGGFDGSPLRRSFSMNACVQCEGNVISVADILRGGHEEGEELEEREEEEEEEEEEEVMQRGNGHGKFKSKKRNG